MQTKWVNKLALLIIATPLSSGLAERTYRLKAVSKKDEIQKHQIIMKRLSIKNGLLPASTPEAGCSQRLHHLGMPDYVTIDASIMLDFITILVSNISYFIPINK